MKAELIPHIVFKDLGQPSFAIETPAEHIRLHTLLLAVAKKGSGKTFFITILMRMLNFDIIIVVSNTFDSNKKMMESLPIELVIDPDDKNAIDQIIAFVNKERDDLEMYLEKKKQYKEFQKMLSSNRYIPDEMLEEFYTGTSFEPPKHRWNGRKPIIGVFVDDAQNSKIMGAKLSNLAIKHRHIGAFKDGSRALGISLFIAVQNYVSSNNGLPKAIRGNVSHIALWKTGNKKELELLAHEQSGNLPETKFYEAYNYVFDEKANKHDFLFIDLAPKNGSSVEFRKNYNIRLISS